MYLSKNKILELFLVQDCAHKRENCADCFEQRLTLKFRCILVESNDNKGQLIIKKNGNLY